MLLLRAKVLGTYELPVREGHPAPVGMVQLFDETQQIAMRLPASPEAHVALAALPPFSDVIVELTTRELDLGRTGSLRGRAHRLRVTRVRNATPAADPPGA